MNRLFVSYIAVRHFDPPTNLDANIYIYIYIYVYIYVYIHI